MSSAMTNTLMPAHTTRNICTGILFQYFL